MVGICLCSQYSTSRHLLRGYQVRAALGQEACVAAQPTMSTGADVTEQCKEIREKYSPCDVSGIPVNTSDLIDQTIQVSDALLKLHVPGAGFLKEICTPPRSEPLSCKPLISTQHLYPPAHKAAIAW